MSKTLYLILIVLASTFVGVSAYFGTVDSKDVSGALLALLGTFVGALFAFRLDENKEREKSEWEKIEQINKSLFILVRQYNAIKQISNDLSKYKSEFELAFNLPAFQPPSYLDLKQNIEGLSFLLSKKDPNVLLELSIEQERFEQAIESMRVRNNFYVGEVQPVIGQNQLNGKSVSLEEMKEILGERLFGGAISGAKTVREHVVGSERSIPEMHEKVLKVAKDLYPNEKFIAFQKNA